MGKLVEPALGVNRNPSSGISGSAVYLPPARQTSDATRVDELYVLTEFNCRHDDFRGLLLRSRRDLDCCHAPILTILDPYSDYPRPVLPLCALDDGVSVR